MTQTNTTDVDPIQGDDKAADFAQFVKRIESRLRIALIARYGPDVGREATAEALAWAWEHWERIHPMSNPAGYLYRVGQSKARRFRFTLLRFPAPEIYDTASNMPWVEPKLPKALQRLTRNQRVAVVLVHGYEYSHQEVADLLGLSRSTIQNHVERGIQKLQSALEGDSHA